VKTDVNIKLKCFAKQSSPVRVLFIKHSVTAL